MIVGLGRGGAERALLNLCVSDTENTHTVVSLTTAGKYGKQLQHAGIRVIALHRRVLTGVAAIFEIRKIVAELRPEVVHAWMPHAILVASAAAWSLGIRKIFWGIRASGYGRGPEAWRTLLIVRFLALLSHVVPRKILCVADSARESHARMGFSRSKMVVVRNGFSLQNGTEGPIVSRSVKPVAGIEPKVPKATVGMAARFHKQKDHATMLRAIKMVLDSGVQCDFLLAGRGVDSQNSALTQQIQELGIAAHVKLLGEIYPIQSFYAQLTVHVSASSFGEGMSNSIGESMFLGVPNIATDVGDSAEIVGEAGWVVAPQSPSELAEAIIEACLLPTRKMVGLGQQASLRVQEKFSITKMVDDTRNVYLERNVLALTRYGKSGASSRIRIMQFTDLLARSGWNVRVSALVGDDLLSIRYRGARGLGPIVQAYALRLRVLFFSSQIDLLWVEKEAFPFFPAWLENALLGRFPRVIDFDDAVYLNYDAHRSFAVRKILGGKHRVLASRAKWVVLGNRTLEEHFLPSAEGRTSVAPSVSPLSRGGGMRRDRPASRPFKFGWIGTPPSFRAYLQPHMNFFDEVAGELDAEFIVMGAPANQPTYRNSRFIDWSLQSEEDFLLSIHAGIMPLSADVWAEAKCGYKLIQYMAAGVPVIASPVGVNRDIVRTGENGFLAGAESEWRDRLAELQRSPDEVARMGRNGFEDVLEKYSVSRVARHLSQVFAAAIGGPPPAEFRT